MSPNNRRIEPRWHYAWTMMLVSMFVILIGGSFSTLSGLISTANEGEVDGGALNLAVALNMVCYGLAAPFGAALVGRYGFRKIVSGSVFGIALGALVLSTAPSSMTAVLGWGLLVGTGTGGVSMTLAAVLANVWFYQRRGLVTGVLTASTVVGQFGFQPVIAGLIEVTDWRFALTTMGAATVLVAIIAMSLLRNRPEDIGTRPYGAPDDYTPTEGARSGNALGDTFRALLVNIRRPVVWTLFLVFAMCGATTNGIMWSHFVPSAHHHGMAVAAGALLLSVMGFTNIFGTLLSGWLTDRVAVWKILTVVFVFRGVFLALLPIWLGPSITPWIVGFSVAFGVLDLATVPPVIRAAYAVDPQGGGILFGWINLAHQVGAGLMSLVGGFIMQAELDSVLWVASGIVCLVAGVTSALFLRRISPNRVTAV